MVGGDFPADLLQAVLHRLPPADVARAACVCRLWRAVASDRAMLEAAFRTPWGVRRVLGDPATRAFWRAASLARFALSHTVRRGDTVPGVVLNYSVQGTSTGEQAASTPSAAASDVNTGVGALTASASAAGTSTDKNMNYAVLAGTIAAGLSALGWYLLSKPKKTEEVVD